MADRIKHIVWAFLALTLMMAASGAQAPVPIHEGMFVSIGGIDQWVAIKGDDRKNPVVLFLHGGPGDAASPFADSMFSGWEKDFTLVQWDQRGAGRTFGKTGAAIANTMTMDRMIQDGVEITTFLTKHIGKQKVIVLGGSWGSILGVNMVHARPDLFYAYVGNAQMVNWSKNTAASYARTLELARAAGDQAAIAELTTLGTPPWTFLRTWAKFRKWERGYQAKLVTAPPVAEKLSPEYSSPQERAQWVEADDFNFVHFVGLEMTGPLTAVDLPSLGTDFLVPFFIVQGKEDLTASPKFARAYFDSIRAPLKQFYLAPGSGHEPTATSLALTRKVLIEQVRPLTLIH